MDGDRTVDLLKLLKPGDQGSGLKIVKVNTTEPEAITFTFEGSKLALDLDIFEVPVGLYPLRKGDRFLAYPILGQGVSQRWGLLQKLNGGVTLATMTGASSLSISGIDKEYGSSDLVIPPYIPVGASHSSYSDPQGGSSDDYLKAGNIRALKAGDVVSIAPTWQDDKIKYVILNRY